MMEQSQLKELRQMAGLNQSDFARKIGYSREVVNKIESGKMEPSKWYLQAVAKFQREHWVVSMEPDVKILGKISQDVKTDFISERRAMKNRDIELRVPLVGIKAQAGYLKGFEHTDFMDTLEKYSLPPGVISRGLEWSYFEVDGDSMEPNISDGDMLLTSLVPQEDWKEVKSGNVYVLLTADQLLVKRVYAGNGNQWKLVSDNSQYLPVEMDIQKVKQVWLVRRQIRSRIS